MIAHPGSTSTLQRVLFSPATTPRPGARWADGGLWLECPDGDGGWTFVPSLLDYFIGKEIGAVEISEEQARAIALARGTDLDDPET